MDERLEVNRKPKLTLFVFLVYVPGLIVHNSVVYFKQKCCNFSIQKNKNNKNLLCL